MEFVEPVFTVPSRKKITARLEKLFDDNVRELRLCHQKGCFSAAGLIVNRLHSRLLSEHVNMLISLLYKNMK